LTGVELADATITRHQGLYYLFGVTRDGAGGYSDTLSIYFAEKITGPWRPHEQNPILVDRSSARPAGAFFHRDGALWRPIQDCSRGYGAALVLSEVQCLSPKEFKQVARKTIAPSRVWPGRKLHTLNRSGRLEVIDGSRIQPKLRSILAN
jgi:beta-xylosidase